MKIDWYKTKLMSVLPPTSEIEEGIIYVCNGMVNMRCPCGCGSLVPFRLHPVRHKMRYDGKNITIEGSIWNPQNACRSHFFIENGKPIFSTPLDPKYSPRYANVERQVMEQYRKSLTSESFMKRWFRRLTKKIFSGTKS